MQAVPAPVPTRRLSARRGSISAFDPFGAHAQQSQPLQSSSTLTIVRVTSPPVTPPVTSPDPSSSPRRYNRRLGSSSNSQQQSSPAASPGDGTRLSFAFSSFGGSPSAGGPASVPRPSSPQHHRPSSPQNSRLSLSSLPSKPRLSPEQLLDLARSSTSPRLAGQPSPQLHHPSSPSHSPLLRAHSPLGQNHSGPSPAAGPATFTPLPDDIYLPFLDRPSEVAALIGSPPSAKLFTLLAQTFRDDDASADPDPALDPTKWTYAQLQHHLTTTPRAHTPDTLWVLQARRCILAHSELIWERIKGALGVPPELDLDYDPADFDADAPESSSRSTSSIDTDDISDDHGRAPRGHWDDWDAVMDSPVFDRRPADPASPGILPISLSSNRRFSTEVDLAAVTTASFSAARHLNPDADAGESTLSPTPIGTGSLSPPHHAPGSGTRSPASPASFLSIEPILFSPSPSGSANPPPLSLTTSDVGLGDIQEGAEEEAEEGEAKEEAKDEAHGEEEDPDMISPAQIQGLRISTVPLGSTPPLTSPYPVSPLPTHQAQAQIPASSTASSSLSAAYVAPSPISPLPPYPSTAALPQGQTQSHSRSGSVSSSTGPGPAFRRSGSFSSMTGPFKRTSSWGSIPGAGPEYARSPGSDGRGGGGGGSEYGSEYDPDGAGAGGGGGYDPVGDRAPGNPLFPGNFARLATGPTLVANNPALRSPPMPPPSRYVPGGGMHNRPVFGLGGGGGSQPKMRTFSHGAFGDARSHGGAGAGKGRVPGRPLSWGVGLGPGGMRHAGTGAGASASVGESNYAVTLAGSSAGGSEKGES